jgi:Translin family
MQDKRYAAPFLTAAHHPEPQCTPANVQWAEGKVFETFLKEHRIIRPDELPLLSRDEYLGGVLDFTGELNRYAVKCATARDVAAVRQCRDVVDTLMGVFLEVRAGSTDASFTGLCCGVPVPRHHRHAEGRDSRGERRLHRLRSLRRRG